MQLEAWYITGDPDGRLDRALGPDEPEGESFILVGLTYQECASYVLDHGMLGWAKILPVTLTTPPSPLGSLGAVVFPFPTPTLPTARRLSDHEREDGWIDQQLTAQAA